MNLPPINMISQQELCDHIEDEDFLLRYGNPVAIKMPTEQVPMRFGRCSVGWKQYVANRMILWYKLNNWLFFLKIRQKNAVASFPDF